MDMSTFARRLREVRESKSISAETLAGAIGLNKTTIYRYENCGFKSIKQSRLEAIANFLMVDSDYLIGKSDNMVTQESVKALSKQDKREINDILSMTTQLLKQDGLLFDGKPASEDSIRSIIEAMEIGLEMAKRKNM